MEASIHVPVEHAVEQVDVALLVAEEMIELEAVEIAVLRSARSSRKMTVFESRLL
jgi:hypothetical protein